MKKNCAYCDTEFTPRLEAQKFCSNRCRTAEFRERNPAQNALKPVTVTHQETVSKEMMDRILAERDKVHQHELMRIEAEYKTRTLEARLSAIEEKLKEKEESDDKGIGGFSLTDIISAYTMMQQNKGGA